MISFVAAGSIVYDDVVVVVFAAFVTLTYYIWFTVK